MSQPTCPRCGLRPADRWASEDAGEIVCPACAAEILDAEDRKAATPTRRAS